MAFGSVTQTDRNSSAAAPLNWGTIAATNWLCVIVISDSNSGTTTPPAGWTTGTRVVLNGPDTQVFEAFYKENATGSEASENWSINVTFDATFLAVVLTGRATASAVTFITTATKDENANNSPVTVLLQTGTPSAHDDVLVFAMLDTNSNTAAWTFGQPGGYTEKIEANFGWCSMSFAIAEDVAGGSPLGTLSVTATSAGLAAGFGGYVISVKSGAPPAPANAPTGWFDDELRIQSWFDPQQEIIRWFDEEMDPPAAGGSTTPMTLTASVSATPSMQRSVGLPRSSSSSLTPTLRRALALTKSATATTAATLRRALGLAKSATVTATATLIRSVLKPFSVGVSGAPTLQRTVGLPRLVVITVSPTMTRALALGAKSYSATMTPSVVKSVIPLAKSATMTLTASLAITRALVFAATVALAASLRRSVGLPRAASSSATPTMTRSVLLLAKSATVTLTASLLKSYVKNFSATSNMTPSLRRSVGLPRSVSVAAVVSLTKALTIGAKSTTVTLTPTLRRSVGLIKSATVALAATFVRSIGKPLLFNVGATPSVRRALTIGAKSSTVVASPSIAKQMAKNLSASVSTAATMRRSIGKTLAVVLSPSASIVKSLAVTLFQQVQLLVSIVIQASGQATIGSPEPLSGQLSQGQPFRLTSAGSSTDPTGAHGTGAGGSSGTPFDPRGGVP